MRSSKDPSSGGPPRENTKLEGLRYKDPKKLRHHLHGFSAGHGARDDGSLTRAALERCLADLNIGLTPAAPVEP